MKNKDEICIVVQARLGSERVPGKMLKPFSNSNLVDILFKKLKNSNNLETRNNIYKNFFYLIYTFKRLAKAFILNEN